MRKTPDRVKRLQGTSRKDRRRNPPRPPSTVPRARPGLPKAVRIERTRLLAALSATPGLLTMADDVILELTAEALAEYHQAVRVLLEQGASYECKTQAGAVMRRARPEQTIADAAWRRAVAGLRELGLSPAARTRIDVAGTDMRAGSYIELRSMTADAYQLRRAKTQQNGQRHSMNISRRSCLLVFMSACASR